MKNARAILSLDIGTTLTKAVIYNIEGQEIAVVERACTLQTPQPGWVELDPNELWTAVLDVIHSICGQLEGIHIQGVALSTQGGSLLPVDAAGNPTYNLITWLDRRSESLVANWQETGRADRIRAISGWGPQPGLPLPSICALRQTQPDIFTATHKFLSVNDFIVHRLTGEYATNPSMAGEMLLTNIKTGDWDQELCDLAGIQIDQLSSILPSEAIIGEIRPEICEQTGLPAGVPLINGGQDHSCEALALGITEPGNFLLACGTAWVINGAADSPEVTAIPPEMALNYHVIPKRYIASQFLGGLGAGMEWWLDQLWQNPISDQPIPRAERYASFNEALTQTEPGCTGLCFHAISGTPRTDWAPGGYSGLRLNHTRADMGRAVLESAAFELRWALESIRSFGLPVEDLWLVGGATRNPLWSQILADVTDIPISLTQYSHGPALGVAMLAARSLGLLDDLPRWIMAQTVKPNPEHREIYTAAYASYLEYES
jgi:xylulokinase